MTTDFSVTLTYQQRGTRPPIFVAGTFTEPPWTPQEMECSADKDGQMTFSKTCVLKPGEDVQYKFRVGTGNWWVLDESSPTAIDPQGNVNNVLRVPSSTENDAHAGRPRTSTSATLEGDENASVVYDSTTNLLRGPGKGNPTYGATSAEQAAPSPPNGDAEGTRGQSEFWRPNDPRGSATDAEGTTPAKTSRSGWFSRIFQRVWAGIGSFFRKLFGRNPA